LFAGIAAEGGNANKPFVSGESVVSWLTAQASKNRLANKNTSGFLLTNCRGHPCVEQRQHWITDERCLPQRHYETTHGRHNMVVLDYNGCLMAHDVQNMQ
jgi:hypothetical protein